MDKIIQIATCAAENGHSLYALTEEGKVYERVYNVHSGEGINRKVYDEWEEIEEVRQKAVAVTKLPY